MEIYGNRKVSRGDMFYADLNPVTGAEQGGVRPILIVQNNTGNKYSPTIIGAAITSKKKKRNLPTHVFLPKDLGLLEDSIVMLEQIRTLDKSRLMCRIGRVDDELMDYIDSALGISVGLEPERNKVPLKPDSKYGITR